ncbi:hypothetical protein [Paenibacillus taichungensis]
MATAESNFNSEVEEIARRYSAFGKVFTHWGDHVEELLDRMPVVLTRFMGVKTKLVVVWDRIKDEIPSGKSEVWIISKQPDGIVGSPITTPSLEGFLNDLYRFGEGKLPLIPVDFTWFSDSDTECNMIRNH